MRILYRLLTFVLIFNLVSVTNLPVFADDIYQFQEQKQLTKEEENIWKFKMQRLMIRQISGKWQVIQGINTQMQDIELLRLVGNEQIALDRLKGIQNKQAIGSGLAILGLLLGAVSALFISNLIKIDNGIYYGIGGAVGGFSLVLIGNSISPIILDEADHIITLDEAKAAVQEYNKELRQKLQIPDSIE